VPKDRIKDALDHINGRSRARRPGGGQGEGAVWKWLDEHKEVKGISELLSLGGFRGPTVFHDADKTEMRQYQRDSSSSSGRSAGRPRMRSRS